MNFHRKIWQSNYRFVTLSIFTILLISIPGSALASSKSPYDSGYDHGCDDAGISDSSDRYINQPEKGPSFHTSEFMNGYNSGYNSCSSSNNNYNSENNPSNNRDSSRSTNSNPEECKRDFNEAGELVSELVPGGRLVGKVMGSALC